MNAIQQKLQQSHIKKEQNKEVAYNNKEQAIEMNAVASGKNKTVKKHRSKHSQVLMMVSSALDVGRESMMGKSKNKKGNTTDTTTFVPSPSTPLNVSIQSPTVNTEDNKDNENEATTPVGFFDVDDEEEEEVEGVEGIEENEIHKMENEILEMEEQLDKGMDSPSNVKEDLEERPKRRSRGEKIKGGLKKKLSSPLKRLSSVFGKKKKKKNEIADEVAVEKSSPKKKKKKKKSGLKSGSKSQKKNDTQGRGSSGTFEDLEAKLARLEKLGR